VRNRDALYEPPAFRMASYIVSFAVVAGFPSALWLLVFGVNERWSEQAKAAGKGSRTIRHTCTLEFRLDEI
jgi:hypothetical protein